LPPRSPRWSSWWPSRTSGGGQLAAQQTQLASQLAQLGAQQAQLGAQQTQFGQNLELLAQEFRSREEAGRRELHGPLGALQEGLERLAGSMSTLVGHQEALQALVERTQVEWQDLRARVERREAECAANAASAHDRPLAELTQMVRELVCRVGQLEAGLPVGPAPAAPSAELLQFQQDVCQLHQEVRGLASRVGQVEEAGRATMAPALSSAPLAELQQCHQELLAGMQLLARRVSQMEETQRAMAQRADARIEGLEGHVRTVHAALRGVTLSLGQAAQDRRSAVGEGPNPFAGGPTQQEGSVVPPPPPPPPPRRPPSRESRAPTLPAPLPAGGGDYNPFDWEPEGSGPSSSVTHATQVVAPTPAEPTAGVRAPADPFDWVPEEPVPNVGPFWVFPEGPATGPSVGGTVSRVRPVVTSPPQWP